MPAAIPLSKADELFNEFSDLIASNEEISEFTLAKFMRAAKEQLQYDPCTAHVLLGAVSANKFDLEGLHHHHCAAITLNDSLMTRGNYAVSLKVVSLLSEAADQFILTSKKYPEDLAALFKAIEFCWHAGRVDLCRELFADYMKRGGKDTKLMDVVDLASNVLNLCGITDDLYQRSISAAHEVLREEHVRPINNRVEVDSDKGYEGILYSIFVNRTQQEVDLLQDKLAIRMCEKLGDEWRPDVLMFEFSPL